MSHNFCYSWMIIFLDLSRMITMYRLDRTALGCKLSKYLSCLKAWCMYFCWLYCIMSIEYHIVPNRNVNNSLLLLLLTKSTACGYVVLIQLLVLLDMGTLIVHIIEEIVNNMLHNYLVWGLPWIFAGLSCNSNYTYYSYIKIN